MRRILAKSLFISTLCMGAFLHSGEARANKLDLTIARFIECTPDGADCRAHNDAYERFMSEYAFGISPKINQPASTLGYSGFYLGLESSVVTVPSTGTQGFNGNNFEDARWKIGTGPYNATPPAMLFSSLHVRKGLPWSMELESSISYLAQSELVALGGGVKWSPFEGYRKGFRGVVPDVSARGSVNRILGQTDVDMTLVSVNASISMPFGIGGMISLEPYVGYEHMWTFIRTEPMIMKTGEETGNIVFHASEADSWDVSESALSGPNLSRHKIFFGLNFRYELLSITMDWIFGLPNEWTTDQGLDDSGNMLADNQFQATTVKVDTQFMFEFGAALQF